MGEREKILYDMRCVYVMKRPTLACRLADIQPYDVRRVGVKKRRIELVSVNMLIDLEESWQIVRITDRIGLLSNSVESESRTAII